VSKRPPDARTASPLVSTTQNSAAISQLVEANLQLVVGFAHRFGRCGLPTLDLIHAGNLGLVEAARRFNPARDTTFVGYASWWVRQAMIHAISDRTGVHPMSPAAIATPLATRVVAPLVDDADEAIDSLDSDIDDPLDEDADFDETVQDIERHAGGTPRSADRLRSHLN